MVKRRKKQKKKVVQKKKKFPRAMVWRTADNIVNFVLFIAVIVGGLVAVFEVLKLGITIMGVSMGVLFGRLLISSSGGSNEEI